MKEQTWREFTPAEHETWRLLYNRQAPALAQQLHPIFVSGLNALGFSADQIPDLSTVNSRLQERTGFTGVPVEGLEEAGSFFSMLAERTFPIGNFIRDRNDLSYTPAPDVFHDYYGHIPFLADKDYAEFTQHFGATALRFAQKPDLLRQFERLFWFGVEFPVINTSEGRRIFGGGIASSFTECAYALSDEPEVAPFSLEDIRMRDYRIDALQTRIYLLESPDQLYRSVDELARLLA